MNILVDYTEIEKSVNFALSAIIILSQMIRLGLYITTTFMQCLFLFPTGQCKYDDVARKKTIRLFARQTSLSLDD